MTKYAVIEKALARRECIAILFNNKKEAFSFCKMQSRSSNGEFIVVNFGMGEFVTSCKNGKEVK